MKQTRTFTHKGRKVEIAWTGKRHTIKLDGFHFGVRKDALEAELAAKRYIDAHPKEAAQ